MSAEGAAPGAGAATPEVAEPAAEAMPQRPYTLCVDVGGSGVKASVLDASGRMLADRVRVPTRYPFTPEGLVTTVRELARPLPRADRAALGFPGVVREGRIVTAPHFVAAEGPVGEPDPGLVASWRGFDAASALAYALKMPVRMANDADLQGLAVVQGRGVELVVTFGTGVGTALFSEGTLAPHLELGQHPLTKKQSYDERLGDAARRRVGNKKWRARCITALGVLDALVHFDRCYVGGGNARHLAGHLGERFVVVDNVAGILGGLRLFEEHPPRAASATRH